MTDNEIEKMDEKERLLDQQHDWYKRTFVLFEILKECKNRTFDILNSKKETEKKFGARYIYAGNISYFCKVLKTYGMITGSFLSNLYRSNGLFKDRCIPITSFNLAKRKESFEYVTFDKHYVQNLESFDLIFDIDSPVKDVMDAYSHAKGIKSILDDYRLPYYCKNSGFRGFHLIIPAKFIKIGNAEETILAVKNVLYNISGIYRLEKYLDESVANPKGIIKCSYSFSEGNISFPLSDEEFDNFSPEKVSYDYILRNKIVKDRGLLVRNHGLHYEELLDNVRKFINDFVR